MLHYVALLGVTHLELQKIANLYVWTLTRRDEKTRALKGLVFVVWRHTPGSSF